MKTSFMQIRKILNIHDGESRMAALVIGIMLLTSAGFTLGSTGIEALFFARFGVKYLPYMYMILGTLSFLTSLGITALLGRFQKETLYIFIPLFVAGLTLIAWLTLFSGWNIIYPILWLGKEVINSLIGLVVWGIAGRVCNTRQSKRLFPLFNAGRILGSVIGGISTGLLVNLIGTANLMIVWAVILVLTFIMIRTLLASNISNQGNTRTLMRKRAHASLIEDVQQGFQFVRKSTLMIWVSISAVLFSILYFSIALPFSQSALAQYPDENALAGFLGIFNGLSTAAAFLASMFIANRLYAWIGIVNALLILPIIYLAGFGGLAVSNIFIVIVIFRFAQMVWLSGIADSAYQAIFNPVPAARRDQVRAFIDGVPSQAGTFIAGGILIIGEQTFSSNQLALVGLSAAIATTYVIWKAGRAYNFALVDALKKGRPTIFSDDDRVGIHTDSAAIQAALAGMTSDDPIARRVSGYTLGMVNLPSASDALISGLNDADMDVQVIALNGIARQKIVSALKKVSALLSDPQAVVRAQAVDTLRAIADDDTLKSLVAPILADSSPNVRVRAMVALLSLDANDPIRSQLRSMSIVGEVEERVLALHALAEIGDPNAQSLFANELNDFHAPIPVRCAAASALAACGNHAISVLTNNLSSDNILLRESIATALGKIGQEAVPLILDRLDEPASEDGALTALDQQSVLKETGRIRKYIDRRIKSALTYEDIRQAFHKNYDPRIQLLADTLEYYARRDAVNALCGFSLLGDKDAIKVAIDNLISSDPSQRSNALETLETVKESALIRPLLRVFEANANSQDQINEEEAISLFEKEKDEWLEQCFRFAFDHLQKDEPMEKTNTLSVMERVLYLHRVPLLKALPPQDIQRVADIASDQDFTDGEVICEQGEAGDEMYVIVSGEVRIMVQTEGGPAKEIARRKAGDVVGEMSIISGDARIATMIASGDTRALCLDRLSFEGLLRERPEVSLAVLRELCSRVKQISNDLALQYARKA